MDPAKTAELLTSQGSEFIAWFLVVVLAGAILWLYKNTVPKDMHKEGVQQVLANQTENIKTGAETTATVALLHDLVKDLLKDLVKSK
jgi:NADH:ubiquinone oxidoreductase subunit 6 (subunit J)